MPVDDQQVIDCSGGVDVIMDVNDAADKVRRHRFVATHGRYEVASRSEMLAYEIAFPLAIHPSQMDGALALDIPDDLRHSVFRRNRDQHMHMVGHEVAFLYLALLPSGEVSEHLAQMLPQLSVQCLSPALGNEDHMVLALPLGVA